MDKENKRRDSDDGWTKQKLQADDMQRMAKGVPNVRVRQKQRLAFSTGRKTDSARDNEYDQDKQMKYRNNNDNQNESEV